MHCWVNRDILVVIAVSKKNSAIVVNIVRRGDFFATQP